MTILVAKRNSKKREIVFASDSQTSSGDYFKFKSKKKIIKIGDMYCGFCGFTKDIAKLQRFLKKQNPKPFRDDEDVMELLYKFDEEYKFERMGMIIVRDGKIFDCDFYGEGNMAVMQEQDFAASGSGYEFAVVANELTNDVEKIIDAVCKHHQGCGGDIQKFIINY